MPPPGPDNDHRGGPPAGTKPPKPGGHPTPPVPHGSGGTGGHNPSATTPSSNPALTKRLQDLENGVEKGDAPPIPSPFDADYRPARGEYRETFKCEGRDYTGYKHNCVDWKATSFSGKWAGKVSDFYRKNADRFNAVVYHTVWKDGKKEECMKACVRYSAFECAAIATAGVAGCAAFPACWLALASTGAAVTLGAGGVLVGALCPSEMQNVCREQICTQ